MKTVPRLARKELVSIIDGLFFPDEKKMTSQDFDDEQLYIFCLNCPDPGGAMDLVVEAPQGSTPASVVDQALAMPPRAIESWSADELSMDHPLRHWKLEI